jgi:hypothetical protein
VKRRRKETKEKKKEEKKKTLHFSLHLLFIPEERKGRRKMEENFYLKMEKENG